MNSIYFSENIYNYLFLDDVALYSTTRHDLANKISKWILSKIPIKEQYTITDATAGVGGNTISFSKYFKHVNSVEINKKRCFLLLLNKDLEKCNNVDVFNKDYLKLSKKLKQDIIFLDVPWGGPSYRKNKQINLKLGDVVLYDLCNQIRRNCKYIVLKVPVNFNFNLFMKKVVCKEMYMKKIQSMYISMLKIS